MKESGFCRRSVTTSSGSASPSMRWADVYVPHVSPASMSPASMRRCPRSAPAPSAPARDAMGRRLRLHAGRRCCPPESLPSGYVQARRPPGATASGAVRSIVATNRRIVRSNTKRPAGYWTIRAPELVPIGFYCGGDALLAPAHSLVVGDVVQLELDLSLDLVFDLDLDLGRVVVQGRRVEVAGEDRRLREARHDDPVDVARAGGA